MSASPRSRAGLPCPASRVGVLESREAARLWRRAAHLSFVGLCSYTVLGFSMMEAAMTVSQLGKDLSSCLHSSCMTRPHSPGPAAAGSTSHDSSSKSSLPPPLRSRGAGGGSGLQPGTEPAHCVQESAPGPVGTLVPRSLLWRMGVGTRKQRERLGGGTGVVAWTGEAGVDSLEALCSSLRGFARGRWCLL